MDYKVILVKCTGLLGTDFGGSAEKLAELVRQQIALGWEPLGGIAIGESGGTKTPHFFQAMVKRR